MHNLRTLHLFAGAGGGILGDILLGHRPVCAVEIDEYCQQVLSSRQKDGVIPWFPIFADVQKFDGHPWRGHIAVVSGGFPCQDISAAGQGKGIGGERSGLWSHMARIIGEVQPRYVLVENSPLLTSRGLDVVLADLAALGFDAEWGVVSAENAGAPHKRDRIWIVATSYSNMFRRLHGEADQEQFQKTTHDAQHISCTASGTDAGKVHSSSEWIEKIKEGRCQWWDEDPADGPVESRLDRVATRIPGDVDRLKAIGNSQVPAVVALAWEILHDQERLGK